MWEVLGRHFNILLQLERNFNQIKNSLTYNVKVSPKSSKEYKKHIDSKPKQHSLLAHWWNFVKTVAIVVGNSSVSKSLENGKCRNVELWIVYEQHFDQRTIGSVLGLCWQIVRWLMERQGGHLYCGPTQHDNFPSISQRWSNHFVLLGN